MAAWSRIATMTQEACEGAWAAVLLAATASGGGAVARIENAEVVIQSQIHPGANACFQRGLESDPRQVGRVFVLITVAPSGDVESATVKSNDGLSKGVATCIVDVARQAMFEAQGPSGSQITVPFDFRHGG
jgi:hypothetical protein